MHICANSYRRRGANGRERRQAGGEFVCHRPARVQHRSTGVTRPVAWESAVTADEPIRS